MYTMRWKLILFSCSIALAGLIPIFLFGGGSAALAQNRPALVEEVRAIEADETGVSNPAGLAFSASARTFHVVAGREPNQPAPVSAAAVSTVTVELPLIQTIDTSKFDPPSPDPSGVTYLPANDTLLIADSEVNEMSIFSGTNLFEVDLQGTLVYTMSTISGTISFSDEPTGMSINPDNKHLFISDDTANTARPRSIYEWNPGDDGIYDTGDKHEEVTSFSTSAFGSKDPEGVTYATDGTGVLYIVDGANDEIYRVDPGANGEFDGILPAGDDQVTSFDTLSLGLEDPSGIVFHPGNGHLYVVGRLNDILFELTTEGALVQMIGIAAANAKNPSGLTFGPGSKDSDDMSIYMVARGIDNNQDPNENDGKMYEFAFDPPSVNINAPAYGSSSKEGDIIAFDGSATDVQDGPMTANLAWTSSIDGVIGAGGSFTSTTLSPGAHTIMAAVTDTHGLIGQDLVNLTVIANGAPTVTINAPANGSIFNEGDIIPFSGDAIDAEDGGLTDDLVWTSSKDGAIGAGGSFNAILSVGAHAITATVTDTRGLIGLAQVNLTVIPNEAPIVIINAPADGSSFAEGESITFSGGASDRLDGDVTDSLVWTSGINGVIGTGGGFNISTLSPGTHTITAMATDSRGLKGQAEVTLAVIANEAPTVTISAPADGSSFNQGESIAFSGGASDAEDDDLTANLAWTSSIDGAIGAGGSFSSSTLSVGTHTITTAVTDSGGLSGQAQITLTVIANRAPVVTINGPADGSNFDEGESIAFSGGATDAEDADLTDSLVWISSINGKIGTGGGFSSSTLSVGTHAITATATDSGGLSGQAQIALTINVVIRDSELFLPIVTR